MRGIAPGRQRSTSPVTRDLLGIEPHDARAGGIGRDDVGSHGQAPDVARLPHDGPISLLAVTASTIAKWGRIVAFRSRMDSAIPRTAADSLANRKRRRARRQRSSSCLRGHPCPVVRFQFWHRDDKIRCQLDRQRNLIELRETGFGAGRSARRRRSAGSTHSLVPVGAEAVRALVSRQRRLISHRRSRAPTPRSRLHRRRMELRQPQRARSGVQQSLHFLESNAITEVSASALSLATIALRVYGRSTDNLKTALAKQVPTSVRLGNLL